MEEGRKGGREGRNVPMEKMLARKLECLAAHDMGLEAYSTALLILVTLNVGLGHGHV